LSGAASPPSFEAGGPVSGLSAEDGEEVLAYIRKMQRRFGETLSVFVTRRCPLRCAHCLVDAGGEAEDLPADLLRKFEQGIGELEGITWLGLTGGEPLMCAEAVRRLSAAAAARSIRVTISTSAFWAGTPIAARRLVASLPNIDHFAISTDAYHLPFVPLDRVRNAYVAAKEAGRRVTIRVTSPTGAEVEAPWFREIASFAGGDLQTGELLSAGRGRELSFTEDLAARPPSIPCISAGPVICEDGLVQPCCNALLAAPRGHALELGTLRERTLPEIVRAAATHPVLQLLRASGFGWLLERLRQEGLGEFLPSKHIVANPCATCLQLFSSPAINSFVSELAKDRDFAWSVAHAACDELNESAVLDSLMALEGNDAEDA